MRVAIRQTCPCRVSATALRLGSPTCTWAQRRVVQAECAPERCTAIVVGSTMLLSVCKLEGYIKALETIRDTLTKGREVEATDFFVGGDLNIEFD